MTKISSKFIGASRKAALAAVPALLALGGYIHAQQQLPDFTKIEEHVLPVQGNVYMMVGAGGNSTVQIGKDGVLVVDRCTDRLADDELISDTI